jgi:diguanylate cyclase (GGDEF)-like protein
MALKLLATGADPDHHEPDTSRSLVMDSNPTGPPAHQEPLDCTLQAGSKAMVQPLLMAVQRLTGVETTFLTLADWSSRSQDIVLALNTGEALVAEGTRAAWCDALCQPAFDGAAVCSSDVPRDFAGSAEAVHSGLRSFFALPLAVSERTVGLLCGASRGVAALGAAELETVALIGQAVASQFQLERRTREAEARHLEATETIARLMHQASTDGLTGLPGRALMLARLEKMMDDTRNGRRLALCYMDLDGFSVVNDQLGREAGNAVLVAAAERLRRVIRQSDFAARLGGDEFVLLLDGIDSVADVHVVVDRVLETMAQPYPLAERTLQLTASIGVALYPDHGEIADQLLRAADQAMYRAKRLGKNRACLTGVDPDRPLADQALLEELRLAMAADQLVLHYQPKVCARTREPRGAEVLVRWQHPLRGLLAPGAFLPVLAGTPLEVELDLWIIERAVRQLAEWHAAGQPLPLSINVTAGTLALPGLAARVAGIAAAAGLPALDPQDCASIELEVLESTALNDLGAARTAIADCAGQGISVALDDFGTGYCSLSYLRQLPVQALKIDRSFVMNMLGNAGDMHIVRAVIGLARAFKLTTVAEGVETPDHARTLAELGCHQLQGFGIARPMPATALEAWLAQQAKPGQGA